MRRQASPDGFFLCVCFRKLAGCTLFITGGSRGIGKAIALKAARDGANVIIAAKTTTPHPKLPGTIYTAAQEGEWLHGIRANAVLNMGLPKTCRNDCNISNTKQVFLNQGTGYAILSFHDKKHDFSCSTYWKISERKQEKTTM